MTEFRLAGRLMMLFAAFMLAATIVTTILTDALMIDLVTIVVYFLGRPLRDGSRRAARWSIAVMGYYAVMGLAMLVGAQVSPERIRLSGRPLRPEEVTTASWLLAAMAAWAGVCVVLLVRAMRSRRHAAEATRA